MTPERFRECLTALCWTQHGFAAVIDVNEREVRRWASGQNPIPLRIAIWLDKLARYHEAYPPPVSRMRSETDILRKAGLTDENTARASMP